ncbi:MAG: SixA phosphatase family protein [Pseudomonadota bacterium]
MKRLYLLHAARPRADPSLNLSDYHLPLTRRGEILAAQLGKFMLKQGYSPDLVICASPARARLTLSNMWAYLASSAHPQQIIHDYRIHLMKGEELLSQLQQLEERYKEVLLVGARRGVDELAKLLVRPSEDSSLTALPELAPGALMVFDCGTAPWTSLAPGSARLLETYNARLV